MRCMPDETTNAWIVHQHNVNLNKKQGCRLCISILNRLSLKDILLHLGFCIKSVATLTEIYIKHSRFVCALSLSACISISMAVLWTVYPHIFGIIRAFVPWIPSFQEQRAKYRSSRRETTRFQPKCRGIYCAKDYGGWVMGK